MKRYLLRRLTSAVVLLWTVASIVFFSVYLLPGDPAQIILGGLEAHPSPEQLRSVREHLGLNRPILTQYLDWVGGILRGNLGRSLVSDRPVTRDLAVRLLRTLQLIVPAVANAQNRLTLIQYDAYGHAIATQDPNGSLRPWAQRTGCVPAAPITDETPCCNCGIFLNPRRRR